MQLTAKHIAFIIFFNFCLNGLSFSQVDALNDCDFIKERKTVEKLNIADILSKTSEKRMVVLAEKAHDQRTLFVIKNYIIESYLKTGIKINLLDESNIYELYYTNNGRLLAEKKPIMNSFYVDDVYLSRYVGQDLFDSLTNNNLMKNIEIFGFDYTPSNRMAINLLLKDLSNDNNSTTHNNLSKGELQFINTALTYYVENRNGYSIRDSLLRAIHNITEKIKLLYRVKFVDEKDLIEKRKNLFKGKMWDCIYQSFYFIANTRDINKEKLYHEDFKEIAKWGILRDQFLYNNIKWFIDTFLDKKNKIIISISSFHALKNTYSDKNIFKKVLTDNYVTAGTYLNRDYKNEMYTIAIVPGKGSYGIAYGLGKLIKPPPKKSFEKKMLDSNVEIKFFDLNSTKVMGDEEFLMAPTFGNNFIKTKWKEFYDGIIFIGNVCPNEW